MCPCYPRATQLAKLPGTHASHSLLLSCKALKDIDSANVKKLTYQKIARIKWELAKETLRILF